MPIISLWSGNSKETGQTLSTVAIATAMAIEHNSKILVISTEFKGKTVENCFWENSRSKGLNSMFGGRQPGMSNGVEGLIKILQSNKTTSNIVADYAKVVFRDRLDILAAPETNILDMYNQITPYYPQLAQVANKDYNFVFIDIDKNMKTEDQKAILQISDLIIVTMKQGLTDLEEIITLKEKNPLFNKNNVVLLVGKYDKNSKYTLKNILRYLKVNKNVLAIPYNALYNEASTEGKVADFFLSHRSINDSTDRNMIFMEQTKSTCDNIIFKIQEMRLRT